MLISKAEICAWQIQCQRIIGLSGSPRACEAVTTCHDFIPCQIILNAYLAQKIEQRKQHTPKTEFASFSWVQPHRSSSTSQGCNLMAQTTCKLCNR
jgi:hypothetical protein